MTHREDATQIGSSVRQLSDAAAARSSPAASMTHRVGLRFKDRELERSYLQGEYQRNRRWILGSVTLAFTMVLLFLPLDRRFIPPAALEHVQAVRIYLLAAAPLLGFIGLLAIRKAIRVIPYLFACTLVAAFGWTVIRAVSGPTAEPYIAFGVAQTVLFIYACMGLPFRWSATAVCLTVLPIVLLSTEQGLASNDFWYTTASLVTVALIASYGALRHEWVSRERFLAQQEFEAEYARRLETEFERSEWLGVIAGFTRHELKNAIAGVGSSLQLLERLDLPAAGSEYVERARRSLQFMRTILSQVGNATSLEGALELQEVEDVDLSRLVSGRVEDFRLEYAGFSIECVVDEGLRVKGNADNLLQMLDKLLNNAVEHAAPNGLIRVTLLGSRDRAQLTVLNHGDALPDDVDSLFRPFVSAGPAPGEGNLGLGLYVALTIARRHGGTIRAEPTVDTEGAIFVVDLPLLGDCGGTTTQAPTQR